MAVWQMAEYSSAPPQTNCISASYSTAYQHDPLVSKIYCSPELVIRLLLMQISSHVFLNKVKHHALVMDLIDCSIRRSKRPRQQYSNPSSSWTMTSDGTVTPHPSGSSLVTTVWLKKFNDDDCEDDENQDSPDEEEDPTTAMPRSRNTLRFACHFHKRAPSRYCAAGCRYKTCDHPGWEDIDDVR